MYINNLLGEIELLLLLTWCREVDEHLEAWGTR